jgi:hypothetical protein
MSTKVAEYVRQHHLALICLFLIVSGGTAWATHPGGANTISSGDIINGEVFSADIRSGNVQNSDMAADAVTGGKIAPQAVQTSDVQNDNLTGTDVATNSLSGSDIDESTLSGVTPSGPASGGHLDGFYPSPTIANNAIVGGFGGTVADGSLTSADLGTDSVGGDEVENGALHAADIGRFGVGSLDFPETGAGTCSDSSLTVGGANPGTPVILGSPIPPLPNMQYTAWVSSLSTVTVRFCNLEEFDFDPLEEFFTATVITP